jgi:hypothetical protein
MITISNFCGVKAASIDNTSPLTLICGANHAGKTSVARALDTIYSADPLPVPGVTKSLSGMLVKSGAAKAEIKMDDGAGNVAAISYPKAVRETEGTPPTASRIATGSASLLAMDKKQRSSYLSGLLHADPNKDDLSALLSQFEITPEKITELWQFIERDGWDAEYKREKEYGANLKGQWQAVTGHNYGTKLAQSYLPEGYDAELMGESEETLKAKVNAAREATEALIATAAVDDSERDRLQAEADKIPELEKAKSEAEAAAYVALDARKQAQITLSRLKRPKAKQDVVKCPCCGADLVVVSRSRIDKASAADDPNELKAYQCAAEWLNKKDTEARQAKADADVSASKYFRAKKAADDLQKLPQGGASEKQIEAARTAENDARQRLEAWTKKHRADGIHAAITQQIQIVKALAIDGLRQQKLSKLLTAFCVEKLAPLSDVAKFEMVFIDFEMNISYNDRDERLLSKSEKYRVDAILQTACAKLDKSAIVVYDGADILDAPGRNGLIRMARAQKIPAVILMTISGGKANAPKVARWIEDGILL